VVSLGQILRAVGDAFLRTRPTTPFQRKALYAIQRCRTAVMGSVYAVCDRCGVEHLIFRSCRNRHCPSCQANARDKWLEARERELLPVPYFHVVFTVPEILNDVALYCPEVFYAALLRAAGNTVLDVGRSKLKALLGCLTILHTWGQNLSLHPHVHCVVPGGGFSLDGKRWVPLRNSTYLLPVKVLRRRFRTLLCHYLREAERKGKFARVPKTVLPHAAIEGAWAQEWIAYVKQPFGGPRHVLRYLARYTHRVAISNRRILSFSENKVIFRWRDYADANRSKLMVLEAAEFVRRFLMHVLPPSFVKIRYFGFLANRRRTENIELARTLLGATATPVTEERIKPAILCPACFAAQNQPSRRAPITPVLAGTRPPPRISHPA
jgi:hypothetical protein